MGVDGSKELGQTDIGSRFAKRIPRVARGKLIARWRKRQLPLQLFAVIRHVERADGAYAFVQSGKRWSQTEDFLQWPLDPPISDGGMEAAQKLKQQVRSYVESTGSQIHVVICSPYRRCVMTAVEICQELGPKVRMLIDREIGEVFGPAIMGPHQPVCPVRPEAQTQAYCQSHGVFCYTQLVGKWPTWPEDLKAARLRYANRFLRYLQRSAVTRRNFIMVTHADCVASALSMMPSRADHAVQSIDYGGTIVAKRVRDSVNPDKGHRNSAKAFSSVFPSPVDSQHSETNYMADDDSPTVWETHSDTWQIDNPKIDNWFTVEPSNGALGDNGTEETLDGASLQIPQDSDGWHVQIQGIKTLKKIKDAPETPSRKSRSMIFKKKVKTLAKNGPFTREQITTLLGELADKPLALADKFHELELSGRPCNNATITNFPLTQLSLSTFLFGASDVGDMSDFGSTCSTACGSRVPTYQDISIFDVSNCSTAAYQPPLLRDDRRCSSRSSHGRPGSLENCTPTRDSPVSRHTSVLHSGNSLLSGTSLVSGTGGTLLSTRRKLSHESSEDSSQSDKSPGSGKRTANLSKAAESSQWKPDFEEPDDHSGGSSSCGSSGFGKTLPVRRNTGQQPGGDDRKPVNTVVEVTLSKPVREERKAEPLKSPEGSQLAMRRRNMKQLNLTLQTAKSEVGLPSDIVQEQDTPISTPG